jgi:hypothetical protein
VPIKFWRQFWQRAWKVFGGNLAKCQEIFWRQIYEMPLISISGSFQKMPPKLFPSSFGKVPANPNTIGKCLQIQMYALKFKFWNQSQNLESQFKF